jgi:hypothetical protein
VRRDSVPEDVDRHEWFGVAKERPHGRHVDAKAGVDAAGQCSDIAEAEWQPKTRLRRIEKSESRS